MEAYFHEVKFTDQSGQLQTTRVPVVQELARQGIKHLPARFIRQARSDRDLEGEVRPPVVDLARIRLGSDPVGRARGLDGLAEGAREWGMFLITNHGIDGGVLEGVRAVVRGFFGLSFEEKRDCVGTYASVDNMGYGRNYVKSEGQALDWIDRLTMQAAPGGATDGLLVWPRQPPNFRQAMEKYVEEAREVLDELLQGLAEALSLPRDAFLRFFHPEQSEVKVRVNYYPPCPRPDLALGMNGHSDPSALTLLIQSESDNGLQVLKDSARWSTVEWPEGSLLVALGDLMEIMSDGRLKSPWHRAVTRADSDRFSVALFYSPPPGTVIEPAKEENSDGEGYKKVVVGEYVRNYYDISPTASKQAILFAKT